MQRIMSLGRESRSSRFPALVPAGAKCLNRWRLGSAANSIHLVFEVFAGSEMKIRIDFVISVVLVCILLAHGARAPSSRPGPADIYPGGVIMGAHQKDVVEG